MPRMAWGGWRLVNSVRSTGSSPTVVVSTTDPNWWQRFQFKGVNPAAVLDFENGLYWDGTTTFTSPSTMLNNGTITAGSGLLCNANNITIKGAALSGFQGGNYTVQTGTRGGTNGVFGGIVTSSADGSTMLDQILIEQSGGSLGTVKNPSGTPLALNTTGHPNFVAQTWEALATSVSGTYRAISALSPATALETDTDANNFVANPFAIFLGSLTPQFSIDFFGGFMTSLAITNSAAPSNFLILNPAFSGPNAFWYNQSTSAGISYGNILQYEYTQPWTVIFPFCLISSAGGGHGANTGVIFSNVPDQTPYPGREVYFDGNGSIHVRLINTFVSFASVSNVQVGVYDSTNWADARLHWGCVTYDGSGVAAGVKIYVDGVNQATTIENDNLAGNSIKSTISGHGNFYFIGNQSPATGGGTGEIGTLAFPGSIGRGYREYNAVKSLSFIQQFQTNQLLPAIDASCVLAPSLSEGGASTTTADLSSSGFTGTFSAAGQWLRG